MLGTLTAPRTNMLTWISLVLLLAFFVAGGVDGIYFHMLRFRLWAHPESRTEHLLHSMRAVVVPPLLWALFLAGPTGLYVAVALVVVDVVATVLDVVVEPRSRQRFGGLPRAELALHVAATVFHIGGIGFAFAGKIAGATPPDPGHVASIVAGLIVVSTLAAIHHVVLVACGSPVTQCLPENRRMA